MIYLDHAATSFPKPDVVQRAVQHWFTDLGVSAAVDTVSYGEEKPLCRQATEDCWAENRRDEFQVER